MAVRAPRRPGHGAACPWKAARFTPCARDGDRRASRPEAQMPRSVPVPLGGPSGGALFRRLAGVSVNRPMGRFCGRNPRLGRRPRLACPPHLVVYKSPRPKGLGVAALRGDPAVPLSVIGSEPHLLDPAAAEGAIRQQRPPLYLPGSDDASSSPMAPTTDVCRAQPSASLA